MPPASSEASSDRDRPPKEHRSSRVRATEERASGSEEEDDVLRATNDGWYSQKTVLGGVTKEPWESRGAVGARGTWQAVYDPRARVWHLEDLSAQPKNDEDASDGDGDGEPSRERFRVRHAHSGATARRNLTWNVLLPDSDSEPPSTDSEAEPFVMKPLDHLPGENGDAPRKTKKTRRRRRHRDDDAKPTSRNRDAKSDSKSDSGDDSKASSSSHSRRESRDRRDSGRSRDRRDERKF